MPKYANPTAYMGKQANQQLTGQARFATEAEAIAGEAENLIISPATLDAAADVLIPDATEIVKGKARLATAAEATAGVDDTTIMTPAKVALVAIAGAPLASEGSPGIAELATQAETNTGTDDARIVTPLKLKTNLTTPPAIGGTTPNTGAFTTLTATATGAAIALTSDTASSFGVTGAGVDLTLSSAAGRVVVNGEEAAADAIRLLSAAGGVDVDAALQINIASSQNAANSIVINSSAGGIDITASGAAAGEDIDIAATGSSVNISSSESAADSITIVSSAGGIDILATGAAAGEDIDIVATGSSVNIRSTENAGDSVVIESTSGGIQILASGAAAGEDINLTATGSSINLTSTEDAAQAIYLRANGGTSETIQIHADQGTGAASINVLSDVGGVTIQGGVASADAINIVASNAAGGIDIDAGTAGVIVDTTGAISLDSAAASNFTATGAGIDLTLASVGGSVLVSSTEDAALAIRLHANGGTSETIQIHSDQGTGVASVGLLSDVGGITIRSTGLASDDAINLEAAAGGIDMDSALLMSLTSSRDNAQAILIEATAGGIDISASGASAGEDIDITATGSSVNITATESAADSIKLESTTGGIDILASGAAAGEDIDIIATGSSVNITSTEAAANAIVLTASNAAGGIDLTTGGGSIDLSSAGSVTMAAGTDTQAGDTCTVNKNVFSCTYTGFTTAAAASQVFNVTNSVIGTTSQVFVTLCNEGSNDAQMTITRVKRTAGQLQVTAKNNGAAALNGNVTITGWCLN